MAHIHSIKKLLNIKDPNIILNENSVKIEKKDGVECTFIDGKLTYQPIILRLKNNVFYVNIAIQHLAPKLHWSTGTASSLMRLNQQSQWS